MRFLLFLFLLGGITPAVGQENTIILRHRTKKDSHLKLYDTPNGNLVVYTYTPSQYGLAMRDFKAYVLDTNLQIIFTYPSAGRDEDKTDCIEFYYSDESPYAHIATGMPTSGLKGPKVGWLRVDVKDGNAQELAEPSFDNQKLIAISTTMNIILEHMNEEARYELATVHEINRAGNSVLTGLELTQRSHDRFMQPVSVAKKELRFSQEGTFDKIGSVGETMYMAINYSDPKVNKIGILKIDLDGYTGINTELIHLDIAFLSGQKLYKPLWYTHSGREILKEGTMGICVSKDKKTVTLYGIILKGRLIDHIFLREYDLESGEPVKEEKYSLQMLKTGGKNYNEIVSPSLYGIQLTYRYTKEGSRMLNLISQEGGLLLLGKDSEIIEAVFDKGIRMNKDIPRYQNDMIPHCSELTEEHKKYLSVNPPFGTELKGNSYSASMGRYFYYVEMDDQDVKIKRFPILPINPDIKTEIIRPSRKAKK